jgi:hypothetical protein
LAEKDKDMASTQFEATAQPQNERLKTLLVALACLSGAATGSYLLYQDFNLTGEDGKGPVMARIEKRESKVRRKAASSFAWMNAVSKQNLFRKDSVQTSEASAAAIRFNDGTLLELGENSLVVIDELSKLSLDFLRGSVVLRTAAGDKRVTVGADGKARFEELPIRLVKPEPLAHFFNREGQAKPIQFAWTASAGAALPPDYMLEVSQERSFKGSKKQFSAANGGKQLDVSATLGAGTYYWRIVGKDKPLTEPGQFRIDTASPMKPSWPVGGEKIAVFGDSSLQLRWSSPEAAAQADHELDVARDSSFKSIVKTQDIPASSGVATLKSLPAGTYYWRIRSQYPDLEVSSPVEQFTYEQAQAPKLTLIYPEDKRVVEMPALLRFAWHSDAQGAEYGFELQNAEGKKVAGSRAATDYFAWTEPMSGSFRWRVVAYRQNTEIAQTPWQNFIVFEGSRIGLQAPAAGQEIRYWDKPPQFAFKWDADTMMPKHSDYSYQTEFSQSPDFKGSLTGPKVREPYLESGKVALPQGNIHWRVHVVDGAGRIVKTSPSSTFIHEVFPTLAAPTVLTPASGEVYNVVEKDIMPKLTWQPVPEATSYELTVFATDGGRSIASIPVDGSIPPGARVAYRGVTAKPATALKGLKPASYFWSVRSIDKIKRKGAPSEARPFVVTYGDVLNSPEVTSPEVQ